MTDLSVDQQVEELAQALLREFMHKKKYYRTLQQFDLERPRTAQTIGSRAVMAELLLLAPLKARALKSDAPEVERGTVMEQLCLNRLGKRQMYASGAPDDASDSSVEHTRVTESIKKRKKKIKKIKLEREAKAKAKQQALDDHAAASGKSSSDALRAGMKLMSTVPTSGALEPKAQVGKTWTPGNGTFNADAVPVSAATVEGAAKVFDVGNGMMKDARMQEKPSPRTVIPAGTVTPAASTTAAKPKKEKQEKKEGSGARKVSFGDQQSVQYV